MRIHDINKKYSNPVNKHLKTNYFKDIDTEQKAYILGLLITDGYVRFYPERKSYRIGIALKEEDKYLLEGIKNELGVSSELYYDAREGKETYALEFSNKEIFDDLAKFNIIPNKTYQLNDIHLELIPKNLRNHYLRGLIDGDGSIWIEKQNNQLGISFCGYNENFVRSFQYAIDDQIGKTEHNILTHSNAWVCKWKGNKLVSKICEYLYANATIYLKRKKEKYDKIK